MPLIVLGLGRALRDTNPSVEIPLTRGRVALVDVRDYPLIADRKWSHAPSGNTPGYATAADSSGQIFMHRVVLGAPDGIAVDHVNGNGLDNRRANLRFATQAQNCVNRASRRGSTSAFKGVYKRAGSAAGTWCASISANGKARHLGSFPSEMAAARAYDRAAFELHGQFAYLNFPGNPS